jgi:NDP-sugar pyrophosphorylase family protein
MDISNRLSKAMILAAGEGTRLKPFTLTKPKVMVPIGGRPLIEYTLEWLKSFGVTKVAINLHYLGQLIADYLGDGNRFGLIITYSYEEDLLGTAGGPKKLEPFFAKDRFILVYGDILTNLDLRQMLDKHLNSGAMATMALFTAPNPHEVGIVEVDCFGRILNFVEKPTHGTKTGDLANGGIYILEPEIFDYIPLGYADFGFHIFPSLLRHGIPLYGYKVEGGEYLIDVGSTEKYAQANKDFMGGRFINYRVQSNIP